MFDTEESIIEEAERIIRDPVYWDSPLIDAFSALAGNYKKLFKQFKRILKMSDRQQIELRESRETVVQCNIDLTREIEEREKVERSLLSANFELKRLAALDGLTELANRRRFDEYLMRQWTAMQREKDHLSLIICDIDHFKHYNDTYGHIAGDECLKMIAGGIQSSVRRPMDLVARYGGEEFAVLLPKTDVKGACMVAELIQSNLKTLRYYRRQDVKKNVVTVSMGISGKIPVRDSDPHQLVAEADLALYKAKSKGRNRFVTYKHRQLFN